MRGGTRSDDACRLRAKVRSEGQGQVCESANKTASERLAPHFAEIYVENDVFCVWGRSTAAQVPTCREAGKTEQKTSEEML